MDAGLLPVIVVLIGVVIMAKFFRHLLGKMLVFLVAEVLFLAVFPDLIVKLADLVYVVRNALS
jgi:hypothetical protein